MAPSDPLPTLDMSVDDALTMLEAVNPHEGAAVTSKQGKALTGEGKAGDDLGMENEPIPSHKTLGDGTLAVDTHLTKGDELAAPKLDAAASTEEHTEGDVRTEDEPRQSVGNAGSDGNGSDTTATKCWGGLLIGHFSSCDADFQLEAKVQKWRHFKERICSQCRVNGVLVPIKRTRCLSADQHGPFANRPTEGFWNECAGLPDFRLVNQTQYCTGPKLVIFESDPDPEIALAFGLVPVDEWLVTEGDHVRLHLSHGTFVPRCSTKRMRSSWGAETAVLKETLGSSGANPAAPLTQPLSRLPCGYFTSSQPPVRADEYGTMALAGPIPPRSSTMQSHTRMQGKAQAVQMAVPHPLQRASGCTSSFSNCFTTVPTCDVQLQSEPDRSHWSGMSHSNPQSDWPHPHDSFVSTSVPADTSSRQIEMSHTLSHELLAHEALLRGALANQILSQQLSNAHRPDQTADGPNLIVHDEFVDRYVSLHSQMASLITEHLQRNPSVNREQRAEMMQDLGRSLAVMKGAASGALRVWRGGNQADLSTLNHADVKETDFAVVQRQSEELGMPDGMRRWYFDELDRSYNSFLRLFRSDGEHDDVTSDGTNSHTHNDSIGLPMEVNKKLRHLLLRQTKFTNRFVGSQLAQTVERAYATYVMRTQLPKLVRRLIGFALLLPIISLAHAPLTFHKPQEIVHVLATTAVPSVILLSAAALCKFYPTQRHWRRIVVAALLLADSCNLWSDIFIDFTMYTPRDKDFHLVWELARFLAMLCAFCMAALCGLDILHTVTLLAVHLGVYVTASVTLYVVWWHESGQGDWTWRFHGGFGGINELNRSCIWLEDHLAGLDGNDASHSSVLLDCIALAFIASITNLFTLHRLSRSQRLSFVNSYALEKKMTHQSKLLTGGSVELLALFSNPSIVQHLPLSTEGVPSSQRGQLQIGREIKSLLRNVPSPYMHIEPAATLDDVRTAIQQHNPQIALFSGHSLVCSLVFELPDSAVDLPNADDFMAALQPAKGVSSKLRCIVLNGCDTLNLAISMVGHSPLLTLVCWGSIVEDGAARAFASGFYRSIASHLVSRQELDIELAYLAGLATFEEEGFAWGNPSSFLHPAGHPHMQRPCFVGCDGCSPPVHGQPVLLRNVDGKVQVRTGAAAWRLYEGGLPSRVGNTGIEEALAVLDKYRPESAGPCQECHLSETTSSEQKHLTSTTMD